MLFKTLYEGVIGLGEPFKQIIVAEDNDKSVYRVTFDLKRLYHFLCSHSEIESSILLPNCGVVVGVYPWVVSQFKEIYLLEMVRTKTDTLVGKSTTFNVMRQFPERGKLLGPVACERLMSYWLKQNGPTD